MLLALTGQRVGVALVRVAESALDERDGHKGLDPFHLRLCRGTLEVLNVCLTLLIELDHLVVDFRHASKSRLARFVVSAPLLGERIHTLSLSLSTYIDVCVCVQKGISCSYIRLCTAHVTGRNVPTSNDPA